MPMNYSAGQVGSSTGVVGTNALITHPTYSSPIMSIPQVSNVYNLVNEDRISELTGFEVPYTSVSYGPGVPPEGTSKPFGPVPAYVFNQRLRSWQSKQDHGRPIQEIGQANIGTLARPAF
jgi:hypothetical protein